MRKTSMALLALLAVQLVAVQLPASAQGFYWNNRFGYRDRFNINRFQDRIQDRINFGVTRGYITPAEQARLMTRFNNIASIEAQLRMGGLSFSERRRLQNRLMNLQRAVDRQFYDRQFAGRHWGRWW